MFTQSNLTDWQRSIPFDEALILLERQKMKKHGLMIPVCVLLVSLSGCATNVSVGQTHAVTGAAEVVNVAGTTWGGIDSDNDYYDYTFQANGVLKYKEAKDTEWETTGTWKQNKNEIYMETNNKYAERVAVIKGSHMEGRAWNTAGKKWTWVADKK